LENKKKPRRALDTHRGNCARIGKTLEDKMETRQCHMCKEEIRTDALKCIHCGQVQPEIYKQPKWIKVAYIVLAIMFVIFFIIISRP
jgi:hypothetical protein